MAVCGNPDNRHGIILAKNELAKKYHIQTAETIWQAKKKCPELVLTPPHREYYTKYSQLVNAIYQRYTDLVEPFGIDESWLDVTGSLALFGDGKKIADELREVVKKELGITISAGVSFNKIFAKLGSDYKKPDATTVISRENFRQIVYPLPVSDLLFVGKSARNILNHLQIYTIGDLAESSRTLIAQKLGKTGEMLHDYACGLDDSPVKSIYAEKEIKSIGNSITFRRNLTGMEDIRLGVLALSDSVASRLRKHGLKCATVHIGIKNPSLKTISRQKTLAIPTFLAKVIADSSLELIRSCWNLNAPIRMLSISGSNLIPIEETGEQLTFFDQSEMQKLKKQEQLENTLDTIRGKFGSTSISFGGILHNDLGIETQNTKRSSDNLLESTFPDIS